MSDELVLVLGNKNLSSWSLRPWLLLRQAELPFRERLLPFESAGWRDAIGALSPSRRVPALRVRAGLEETAPGADQETAPGADQETVVIWDSLAICEYLADTFPERRLWPTAPAARAIARSVSAEMHSGFASMRRDLSMDVTARHPRRPMSQETEDDVSRVQALWAECRARATTLRGGDAGPFLFGHFTIADAMFAPVVFRFRTYDVELSGAARAYQDAMLALPAMMEWERDAIAEVKALTAAAALAAPARSPDPRSAQHCYAVIFSSQRTSAAGEAYDEAARAMVELAAKQPGFLGIESAREASGFGITVSYWDSLEAIRNWKNVPAHVAVQAEGRKTFYERYEVRVAVVERGYKFPS